MKRFVSFSFVFFVLAIFDLAAIVYSPEWRILTKPLIMISLFSHFYLNVTTWDLVKRIFALAMIFAWFGDVFLMFDGSLYFLLGLGSFLIMQVLYSVSFCKESFYFDTKRLVLGIFLICGLGFYIGVLAPNLDEMLVPVLLYSACIAMMTFLASTRDQQAPKYYLVLIGALLFMISDGLIAWTRFAGTVAHSGLIIMATYIPAQYFICTGYLQALEEEYA